MATRRTFGWVQNPNLLTTLKKVVAVISRGSAFNEHMLTYRLPLLLRNGLIDLDDYNSFVHELTRDEIKVKYEMMKGKGGKRGLDASGRPNSLCSGIAQAAIDAQKEINIEDLDGSRISVKKPYSDDWTADGYVRWAISTGLLEYDNADDTVSISALGRRLVASGDGSTEEYDAFTQALLSYPPVIRVLSILDDEEYHTKFDIGSQLGFAGEMGFTSIPQNFFFAEVHAAATSSEASKIRSNEEGDSDKYARTIASWLQKMDWVTTKQVMVTEAYSGHEYQLKMNSYKITIKGKRALRLSKGYSRNPRIPKIVYFEMLASKAPDADFLRSRRARIIEFLSRQTRPRTYAEISQMLEQNDITAPTETVKDDVRGLIRIGLNLNATDESVMLKDTITKLVIPQVRFESLEITRMKDTVRERLRVLDHRYLTLIDLAFSDASTKQQKNADAREFEIETASLFVDELDFVGMRLGDSGKPDVIISHDNNGAIIDNKSYKDGFSVDRHCADEMIRYIIQNNNRRPGEPSNEWWKQFDDSVTDFKFLFITSFLKGHYENSLVSIYTNTGVMGGAISVDNLLYIAEKIKDGSMEKQEFFDKMQNTALIA